MQAGRRTKHSGQNCIGKCQFLKFSNFNAGSVPTPAGNGTRKTDAGITRRRWPGTLQGGQGECRRDPGATLQCIPECSSSGTETLPRATLGNT
ncbi:unnamed protein product, partial [Staurois parvus]